MEPLDPRGLCLREGDLVILERKALAPPPELEELTEPSRWERKFRSCYYSCWRCQWWWQWYVVVVVGGKSGPNSVLPLIPEWPDGA